MGQENAAQEICAAFLILEECSPIACKILLLLSAGMCYNRTQETMDGQMTDKQTKDRK